MPRFGRRRFLAATGSLGALASVPGSATIEGVSISTGPTVELLSLSPPDFPENLGMDPEGNLYFGLTSGAIRKVPQELTDETGLEKDDTEVVATFPGGVGGVSVNDDGQVYAAVRPENDLPSGVYAVESDGDGEGSPELVGVVPGFPNDIHIDKAYDRLLVTESSMGRVYAVSLDGADTGDGDDEDDEEGDGEQPAPILSDDSLLAGEELGANGITAFGEGVLVANTDDGRLVSIPVEDDGSAGEPETYVEDEGRVGADGITALGPLVYVAVNQQNEVVRVLPGGLLVPAADADDGLQFPSDVLVGSLPDRRNDLFVCNFSIGAEDPEPGVLRTGL
jgi:sugar lactone lactonase YvrE